MIIESDYEDNKTTLYLLYRDEKNQRIRRKIDIFLPYFYVPKNEYVSMERYTDILKVDYGYKSILGEELKKVTVKNPQNVKQLREKFNKTYEADILFPQRFLIDQMRQIPHHRLRMCVFDIENAAEGRVPDPFLAEKEITSISYYDNFTDKYYQFVWREDLIPTGTINGGRYNNEKDMLNAFFRFVYEMDPDILAGFNNKRYDLVYLIRRGMKLEANFEYLSPLQIVLLESEGEMVIKGRIIMDALELYKHQYFAKVKHESNRLGDIGERELKGISKISFTGTYANLWKENIDKLCEYNEQDVKITKMLFEQFQWVEILQEIHELSFCDWKQILFPQFVLDALLLKRCQVDKIVLPNRNAFDDDEEIGFKGAAVRPVIKGLHQNVAVLDIESLYPNIMRAFNISYETLDPKGDIKLENGYSFTTSKTGVIPAIVNVLYDQRIHYKRLAAEATDPREQKIYGVKQNSLKIILNSAYGYMGQKSARLYRMECAASVTFVGRKLIGSICDFVETKGFKVVASDTDSAIFVCPGTLSDAVRDASLMEQEINQSFFRSYCQARGGYQYVKFGYFKIKFEQIYDKVIFVDKKNKTEGDEGAKKCRAGYIVFENGKELKEPKLEVKGFKSKRSDTSKLAKEVQRHVLMGILNGKEQAFIDEYVGTIIGNLTDNQYDWETIGTPVGISKSLTAYDGNVMARRACLYSNDHLGTEFGAGSKPKVAYISQLPDDYPKTMMMKVFDKAKKDYVMKEFPVNCLAFESGDQIPAGTKVDLEKTINLNVLSKVEMFYDAMGWDFKYKAKKSHRKPQRTGFDSGFGTQQKLIE